MPAEEARDLPFPELLRRLASQTTELVREELELARVELTEKAHTLGISAGAYAGAAVMGLGAFGALTAAFIAAVALALPVWAAASIVALVYGAVAFVLFSQAQARLKGMNPLPTQAIQTTKEDVQWAKTRAESARR
jgi:uncharacterized membrane protein YqjE